MRKFIYSLLVAGVSLGLSVRVASAQEKTEKRELDTRAHDVNALADRHGGMRDAIHDVSVETGVPEGELQRMHQAHPDAGPAGLLIASVLADNTKERPERFLNQRTSGKSWASLARENSVPLEKINTKLDNLERELNSLPATGREGGRYSPAPGYNNRY